ncbi:MAG: hypothetical protein CMD88_03340 [Gammaproteobacteria bacterium]|nr:hypothetical protein [Gammaproteobacteria bacterium]|tara:strand:+ start:21334 stop:22386 length:1053 start_codon:yes stop_codon:yes gene_type:complete
MKTTKRLNIYIAWDIGGAYTKFAIETNSQIKCYIQKCELWKDLSELKSLISNVSNRYKNKKIIHLITMSGEMCDIFDNRNIGVKNLINIFKKLSSSSYVLQHNCSLINIKSNEYAYDNIASMNWIATSKFLTDKIDNAIALDIGSTTTDIILIKNKKLINKRKDDITGLSNHELLYSGIFRTPIYALTQEIKYKNTIYKIIPENFANMSDIYRILSYLHPKYDYSITSDNRSKSMINSMKRLCRVFGFDYHESKKNLLFSLCKQIITIHINHISSNIKYHLKKYKNISDYKIIGAGVGKFLVKIICKRNNWRYLDFDDFCEHKIIGTYKPSDIAPAYSLIYLVKKNYDDF